MKQLLIVVVYVILGVHCTYAFIPPQDNTPWNTSAELGSLISTGNSNSVNINAKLNVNYNTHKWADKVILTTIYGSNEGKATERRYGVDAEFKYQLKDKVFSYARGQANRAYFKPYDYAFTENIGLGLRVMDKSNLTIDVQSGPGGKQTIDTQSDQDVVTKNIMVETSSDIIWKLNDITSITESLDGQFDKTNNLLKSELALQTNFSKALALKISYVMEYNKVLPPESEHNKHLDTTTSVTMVYTL